MSGELAQDPLEREILLRALRAYSDACEHPELTVDCPFSIDIAPGERGCGQECLDILARHDAPASTEEVDLGDGFKAIRVRRPRARRNADANPKPYDAHEIYAREQAKPIADWSLAAIVRGTVSEICQPPPPDPVDAAARRSRIDELAASAQQRGFPADVRGIHYMRISVGFNVFTRLLRIRGGGADGDLYDPSGEWSALVDKHLPDSESADCEDLRPHGVDVGELLNAVMEWALTSDLEDLLEWNPRAPIRASDRPNTQKQRTDSDEHWLAERFDKTFLDEWSTASLHREWRYLHSQHPAPCSSADMDVRAVSEIDLAKVMADRSVVETQHESKFADQMVPRMVPIAAALIEEERRGEAAALFEAVLHLEPENTFALNNLGFCLLPDDPETALVFLERAADSGSTVADLANLNRCLALASVGRVASALGLVESMLNSWDSLRFDPSTYLWDIDSVINQSEPSLVEVNDLHEYAEQIKHEIESHSS